MPGRSGPPTPESVSEAVQQRVHERAGMNAGAGVDHHSGGLVDRHHVLRPHKARERDGLRAGAQRGRVGGFHVDGIAAAHSARGAGGGAFHQGAAGLDPLLNARPAVFRKTFVQQLVQAFAGVAGLRKEAHGAPA